MTVIYKKMPFAPGESLNKFLDSILNASTPKDAFTHIWGGVLKNDVIDTLTLLKSKYP